MLYGIISERAAFTGWGNEDDHLWSRKPYKRKKQYRLPYVVTGERAEILCYDTKFMKSTYKVAQSEFPRIRKAVSESLEALKAHHAVMGGAEDVDSDPDADLFS